MNGPDYNIDDIIEDYRDTASFPNGGMLSSPEDAYRYAAEDVIGGYLEEEMTAGEVMFDGSDARVAPGDDAAAAVEGLLFWDIKQFLADSYPGAADDAGQLAENAADRVFHAGSFSARITSASDLFDGKEEFRFVFRYKPEETP